ncbi:hypothetical protein NQ314_003178 [Rhamnusium bicolor]|uniref:Uncharacterized protein n=1 Tax=Rhamnusium bicolor TaxID=1586634 RepID=A0AAV8ZPN5_9CUCU|nr:hypothetical protein NQ314_003178 [Rhamnusium bicolor]
MDFVIGGTAACGAAIFSNPFDVLKTRMQLQGELRARGTYQWLHKNGYLTDKNGDTIIYKSAAGSAFSGAAGAFFGSPLFLIKTQLQSQAAQQIAVGTQHAHSGALHALKNIYVLGLWRGANATMLRAVVGSSAQLTSFAITKDILRKYEFFSRNPVAASLFASIIGGVFQTVLMTPFDLVSTRLYNQDIPLKKSKTPRDTLKKSHLRYREQTSKIVSGLIFTQEDKYYSEA